MPGLVIIALVSAQGLQQGHAASSEQAVGAQNHQQRGQKKQQNGGDGVLAQNGNGVAGAKAYQTKKGQEPAGAGLLLTGLRAFQQLNGLGAQHAEQVEGQNEQKHEAHQQRRAAQGRNADGGGVADGEPDDFEQQQVGQAVQHNAARQAAQQGGGQEQQAFPAHHPGQMALFQAENVEQPQLPLAAAQQKAVGVKQKHHRKNADDDAAQRQKEAQDVAAGHGIVAGVAGEGVHDVKHGTGENAGEKIRQVQLPVFADVLGRQPQIEGVRHSAHLRLRSG